MNIFCKQEDESAYFNFSLLTNEDTSFHAIHDVFGDRNVFGGRIVFGDCV